MGKLTRAVTPQVLGPAQALSAVRVGWDTRRWEPIFMKRRVTGGIRTGFPDQAATRHTRCRIQVSHMTSRPLRVALPFGRGTPESKRAPYRGALEAASIEPDENATTV